MKALRIVAFGAAALLLLAFLAGSLLPSSFEIERTTTVSVPPATVFQRIADASAFPRWFPGMPASGSVADADAITWSSERGAACAIRITARVATERVELEIVRSGASEHGAISLTPDGSGTLVRWRQRGDVGKNPVMRACRSLIAARAARTVEAALAGLRGATEPAAAR